MIAILKKYYRQFFATDLAVRLNNHKIGNLIKDKNSHILLIGSSYNWYYYDKNYNNITILDINVIKGPKNFIKQSITDKTSFNDNSFDYVIMSIVLEYVIDDIKALREIFRILKDNGTFILQLYYYKDKTNKPLRIYSRSTIIDILKYAKLEPQNIIQWGLFEFIFRIRIIKFIILLVYKYLYNNLNGWTKLDKYFSNICYWFIKYIYDGGDILVCKKNHKLKFLHYN